MMQSQYLAESFEKIPVRIFAKQEEASLWLAKEIADLIKAKAAKEEKCVLGLATGSTPKTLYAELVRMHREEGLSFKNVVAFNLDEYYPIDKNSAQSYAAFMRQHLFGKIDILPENCFIPDGAIGKENIKQQCTAYERLIEEHNGMDLQVLGIGVNGHIGFNEPGSSVFSKTRLVQLTHSTRMANAHHFSHVSDVPRLAITMGISTILKAKRIVLLAWGSAKAVAVQQSVEGPITEHVPASWLQNHDNAMFLLDHAAATELTRIKSPWLTGECEWTDKNIKKAVINMALKLGKPVLSLTASDYNENGLSDLLTEIGDHYEINLKVYYMLRDTITGWPGGKKNNIPAAHHPERSQPYPKRVVLFSPHPDDDIISMGGTFQRLHQQGHDVHVAYQTSGNIAVTDEFVTRFLDFSAGFEKLFGIDPTISNGIISKIQDNLRHKKPGQPDIPEVREIKGLIRRCEAAATCRYVGLQKGQWHFMNLPFYETGMIEKKPLGQEDIRLTVELLRAIQPQQVYCAGDFADPHGTHIVCFHAVLAALKQIKDEGDDWIKNCWLWLYKGAWQEWNIEEIEMAIPMSPDQVIQKRHGIFIHQSQKDMVPFQGSDSREFWQRAEERNSHTAKLYASLGLTQYAAIEAFVRWHF